jgi:hypothetical protein
LEARIERETELIKNCDRPLYNSTQQGHSGIRKEWTVDGVRYSSGAEAARVLGISPSQVYRLMKKKGEIKLVSNTKKVSIEGQEFESLTHAQKVLKIARSTLFP